MSKKLKISLFTGFALFIFFFGMAIAHFQLFPYKQILDLRTSPFLNPFKDVIRESAGSPEMVPAYNNNTALQRLLVKKVPFEKFPVSSSTYVLEAGDMLHVVYTHGEITSFDLNSYRRAESTIPPVPMNYRQLVESPLVGDSGLNEKHFRVLGVHSERTKSGNDQIYVTHHRYEPEEDCVSFVLSRIELNDGVPVAGWETLFR